MSAAGPFSRRSLGRPQAEGIPMSRSLFLFVCAALLVACAGGPPPPDWQLNAHGALQRAQEAYLSGNSRVEAAEFARARAEIARTGRADLLARVELVRCASQVASLVLDDCTGFDRLAQDAAAPERAYARYLAGRAEVQDAALLPLQHRALTAPGTGGSALAALDDPLSRLVAAGVLMRTGRADPRTIALAIDAASSQGWRRPLLAWLGVQALRAEQAGDSDEVARIRRRIALVGEGAPGSR